MGLGKTWRQGLMAAALLAVSLGVLQFSSEIGGTQPSQADGGGELVSIDHYARKIVEMTLQEVPMQVASVWILEDIRTEGRGVIQLFLRSTEDWVLKPQTMRIVIDGTKKQQLEQLCANPPIGTLLQSGGALHLDYQWLENGAPASTTQEIRAADCPSPAVE